jgi:hypothetical protein
VTPLQHFRVFSTVFSLFRGGRHHPRHTRYVTFSTRNAANDNAILIFTWYSLTNKIIEQVYIGKGRASILTGISLSSSIRW